MDWDGIGSFAFFASVGLIGVSFLLGPIGRSIAKRLGGRDPASLDDDAAARLADLEHRLSEMEQAHGRIADLEERLDFAERLLSQSSGADRPPGAGAA